jgi:hypothetical protein
MYAPESQIGFPQQVAKEFTSTVANDDHLIPLIVMLHKFTYDMMSMRIAVLTQAGLTEYLEQTPLYSPSCGT